MAKRLNNDKRHRTQRPKDQIMIKDIELNWDGLLRSSFCVLWLDRGWILTR
jgi:hypothetical protein